MLEGSECTAAGMRIFHSFFVALACVVLKEVLEGNICSLGEEGTNLRAKVKELTPYTLVSVSCFSWEA